MQKKMDRSSGRRVPGGSSSHGPSGSESGRGQSDYSGRQESDILESDGGKRSTTRDRSSDE